MANGLAEWTPNPPLLADRLATTTARIADLQQARDKTAALLADAEKPRHRAERRRAPPRSRQPARKKWRATSRRKRRRWQKPPATRTAALKKTGADLAQMQAATKR